MMYFVSKYIYIFFFTRWRDTYITQTVKTKNTNYIFLLLDWKNNLFYEESGN